MLVLLAEDVFRPHTAEGLHELVPDRLGHPAEVFVHGQVDDLSVDLLELLFHDHGIEREIEAGTARRASGCVCEPGGSARRAPGTGRVGFFSCDEVEEERLSRDGVVHPQTNRAVRECEADDIGEIKEALRDEVLRPRLGNPRDRRQRPHGLPVARTFGLPDGESTARIAGRHPSVEGLSARPADGLIRPQDRVAPWADRGSGFEPADETPAGHGERPYPVRLNAPFQYSRTAGTRSSFGPLRGSASYPVGVRRPDPRGPNGRLRTPARCPSAFRFGAVALRSDPRRPAGFPPRPTKGFDRRKASARPSPDWDRETTSRA